MRVFPRLKAADHQRTFTPNRLISGIRGTGRRARAAGLIAGTSTLVIGPSGAGQVHPGLGFAKAALERGERGLLASFDETLGILLQRSAGVGIDLAPYLETGQLRVEQIDPAEISPGEFAGRVREAVERDGARFVLIDSLTGYMAAMSEQPLLVLQMHEMLTYLNQQGVVTIMILAQHGMIGSMNSPVDLTYVSDCVVLLRFFEARGRVCRALSVLKKRTGAHEDTIREFRIDSTGLRVGPALTRFRGVLTGVPTLDDDGSLLDER
jgi:circadian clock protein KaiC